MTRTRPRGTHLRVAVLAVAVVASGTSCALADKGGDSASGTVSAGLDAVESGLDGSGTPQRGGQYKARSPLLFTFVFGDVDAVTVVNELTVQVTTKVPWVAFPAALYGSGRIGIMAQRQLDADDDAYATQPIGTGPFSFVSWTPDVALRVKRNPRYWQEAPDGKPYPYLNAIEFRPMANSDARVAALQEGELNMLHTSTAADATDNLAKLRDAGAINMLVSSDHTETAYLMMNTSKKIFTDRQTRLAVAHAIDREKLNQVVNKGFPTLANGPFARGVTGYLEKTDAPGYDLGAAKKAVAALKAKGADTKMRLLTSSGPAAIRQAQLEKAMLEAAGFTVTFEVEEEANLISRVIGGDYDLAGFRNQPGGDPDMNRVWWYDGSTNPVNFGRFDDPIIDRALDTGRQTADKAKRRAGYEAINRQFAKESGTCTCGSPRGRWPRPPTSTGSWVRTCPATAVPRRSAS